MIYVIPADNFGCGWYRLRWAAEALAATHHPVTVEASGDPTCLKFVLRGDRIREAHVPDDCELLVFQRPTSRYLPEIIQVLRRGGVSVVVDIDDDLRHIHPANVAFRHLHPKTSPLNNWKNAEAACHAASLVTVSTPALAARYAPHGRCVVLPNCVPAKFLDIPRVDSDVIGWAGSIHSHPDDLQATGNSFARLGASLRIVGNGEGVKRILGLSAEPEATGFVAFHEWGEAVASIGVGIAPLSDTVFNQAKSWLKPLEYSALGVPWVASDRIEYRRLADLGCGVVVEKPKDWSGELRKLIRDPGRRAWSSANGREVARGLTIEANAWKWLEAWQRAIDLDHERLSA